MSLVDSLFELGGSIVEMPGRFAEIAMHDPLSAVLLVFGTLFVGAASAALGYLSLGAFVSLFNIDTTQKQPPEAR